MFSELIRAVSKGKLLATQAVLLVALCVGITLSLLGHPEQAVDVIVPVFITEGVIFAIKRELGIFGIPLRFD